MATSLNNEQKKWRAQQDASALVEADDIKADPKRMKGVAGHIKREEKAIEQQKKKYVAPEPKKATKKKRVVKRVVKRRKKR